MKRNGFTLIELMIVVAVIGILAAIALPAYSDYVNRGKITDALAALSDYRIKMEQYFQDNRNYGTAGVNVACPVPGTTSKYATYACTITGAPSTAYTVTATSVAGLLGSAAGDYTYSVDEKNTKASSKYKGAAVTKSCWLIRGSEC